MKLSFENIIKHINVIIKPNSELKCPWFKSFSASH